ncbi:tetratricopeptide repeat protein [uncultured Lacinutrix sp.]|uniref:tetratricopeptide repeat protein n=1 Tax=uncultured Lacinutrix sp. TaxID=574032 RepID=UPI00260A0F3E|nr:tetratricopeptide repeat protein [uncultured Lacinutrix sp.]
MQSRVLIVLLIIALKVEAQSSTFNAIDSIMANGNFSKAITLLESENINNSSHRLAKAYNAIGNYDKAISNYTAAIKNNPDNTLIKYEYGKLLSKIKANKDALLVFKTLIEIDNTNPNYYYELGVILARLEQTKASQNSFKETYKLDSTHQKAIFKLAKYSLQKKEFERLDTLITVGLNSYAKNAALTSLKAQSMYAQRKYAKAINWFEKLLELGEKSQFIYEKLSFACAKEVEYKKAIEYLKKALLYDPKNTGNLYRLGSLYNAIHDYENAEKNIKLSLQLQDEPLDIQYSNLATVYNRLKKPREAVKYFNKALKENPNNKQVKFYIVVTKSSYYKTIESRIKLFETFIKENPESIYLEFAKQKLSKLKTEQFMNADNEKN